MTSFTFINILLIVNPSFVCHYTFMYSLYDTILFCIGQVLSVLNSILFCMVFLVCTIQICYTHPIKKKTGDVKLWQ